MKQTLCKYAILLVLFVHLLGIGPTTKCGQYMSKTSLKKTKFPL